MPAMPTSFANPWTGQRPWDDIPCQPGACDQSGTRSHFASQMPTAAAGVTPFVASARDMRRLANPRWLVAGLGAPDSSIHLATKRHDKANRTSGTLQQWGLRFRFVPFTANVALLRRLAIRRDVAGFSRRARRLPGITDLSLEKLGVTSGPIEGRSAAGQRDHLSVRQPREGPTPPSPLKSL
jgi:hypothetical protein